MHAFNLPTSQDIAFYKEQGYWLSPKLFSNEELGLPALARLKIYAKMEKKLEQENYSFLFQALKQELKPKLGDK